jgi:hypothetical protein
VIIAVIDPSIRHYQISYFYKDTIIPKIKLVTAAKKFPNKGKYDIIVEIGEKNMHNPNT